MHDAAFGGLQPAIIPRVFRRGGQLRDKRRHGSHVRNVGATSPEPCKWCFTELSILRPVSFSV